MGLAQRKDERENLTRAIEAFTAALRFRLLPSDPSGYAESQMRLGQFHARLAQAAEDPAQLALATEAYREAAKVRTRESDPRGYAALQILIGNVLRDSFVSGPGQKDERMDPALGDYQEALRVATPERLPEAFGQTHAERALAYLKLSDGVFKRTHTRNALADIDEALLVFTKKEFPREFDRTQKLLGDIYMKMYSEVTVDTGTRWRDSQMRYQWQESAKRAYEVAAQFGASRFDPSQNGAGK